MGNNSSTFSGAIQHVSRPKNINSKNNKLAFSNFLSEVDAGRVVEVQIQGNNISGVLADGKEFSTYSPNYPELSR